MATLKKEKLPRSYPSRTEQGFTLIEVLVTMLILVFGLLGTAGLTTGIIRGNFYAKNVTSATAIAESELEKVQRVGYASVTSTQFPSPQTVSMGGVSFTKTTIIDNDTPATNMKRVRVTISWTESSSAARSVDLYTIIADQ